MNAPVRCRRFFHRSRPVGFLLSGLLFIAAVGCDRGGEPVSQAEPAPAPPVAPAASAEGKSVAELRRELGADERAQFVKVAGRITQAELRDSGVTDLEPLRGVPLQRLGISGLPVSDLSPLAGMPLELLTAEGTRVSDVTPLQGLPLRYLYLRDTAVADLTPLAGLPLEELNVVNTPVEDIRPVREMPLGTLWIAGTQVRDLSPLAGKTLASLDLEGTPVEDLSPLSGMTTLRRLNIARSAVTDLTPLAGLRLERLIFSPDKIGRGLDVVRNMQSLQEIGTTFDDRKPADRFWAEYDAGSTAVEPGP